MKLKINWSKFIFELFGMFLGLSAALYADSKVEEFNERKREQQYIKEIRTNLENDILEMDELIEGVNNNFEAIQNLNQAVKNGDITPQNLVNDFGRLLFIKDFQGTFNAFDIIKSKGDLGVITNHEILSELSELYEFNNQIMKSTASVKKYYSSTLEPYLLDRFDLKDYIWSDTITIDASSFIEDQYFQNIVLLSVQKYGEQKVMFELYHKQQKELLKKLK